MSSNMEKDNSNCKVCNQLKVRILVGRYDIKNKKYQDEHGKLWSGRTCPECHREKMRLHMMRKRVGVE